MIHSDRLTVSPVASIELVLLDFEKWGRIDVQKQLYLPGLTMGRPSGSIFHPLTQAQT